MGDMDNFNLEVPKRCPRCGKTIFETDTKELEQKEYICPGCGELYYDEHLGVWRIRYCEKS